MYGNVTHATVKIDPDLRWYLADGRSGNGVYLFAGDLQLGFGYSDNALAAIDAMRDKLTELREGVALVFSPDCERCGATCLDHEELAGACPTGSGWYLRSETAGAVPA